jgi:hypothetical protein
MAEGAHRAPLFDRAMRVTLAFVGLVAGLLGAGALALFERPVARGVALGGLLATANLAAFAVIGRGLVHDAEHARLWGLAGAAKLFALLAVAWMMLARGWAGALELAVGYCALPVGVTAASLLGLRPGEEA